MNSEKLNLLSNFLEEPEIDNELRVYSAGDEYFLNAARNKKEDDEDENEEDDEYYTEEEEEENPFDKEPSEKDLIDDDFPLVDPEEDMFDEDEEIPYN